MPHAMSDLVSFWLHDIASALVHSLAQPHAKPGTLDLFPPYNDVTRFVLHQQSQMPDYLRKPMVAMTVGFDALGLLRSGHLFHSRRPAVRKKQIAAWKNSKLSFERDFIRYYESLALLALYSRGGLAAKGNEGETPWAAGETPAPLVPDGELGCEIAVIGSGPGGAITAALLAEAGRDVLLIEEGPFYQLESCEPFSKTEMLQKYRNGGQTVALGRNKVAYVEGRCVGGGSEINSGLYHRTPPEILELWRKEFRVESLTEEVLRPHFEACERELSVSLLPAAAPAASLKLHEGASRLGWKSLEVPRWFQYEPQSNRGTRQSMTKTFVPRFLRAGGKLLTATRIERIRAEGGKWILNGYTLKGGHRAERIQAENLFVCGGAVQTPALLRRSGITENIGNSLRLHPTVKITAKFAEPVNSADMGVPVHQVKEFAPRLTFGCSISTPPYLALGFIDHPEGGSEVGENWRQMANYYAMVAGQGSGTVRPLLNFKDPLVRYILTDADRRDLADGVRKLTELLFEAGAVALYPGLTNGPRLLCRDDVTKLPESVPNGLTSLMTIHLFSSCPMGEDKRKCATNSFGQVNGFKNLFISDASLLCTPPGVNPQGTVMALARRNALDFLGKAKG